MEKPHLAILALSWMLVSAPCQVSYGQELSHLGESSLVATQLSSIRSSLDSLSASLEVIAINTEPPSQLEKIKDDFISNALWSALGLDGAQRRTSIGILSALGFCFSLVRFVHFLNTAGKRRRQGEVAVSMSMGGGVIVTVFLVLISALLAGVVFQASEP